MRDQEAGDKGTNNVYPHLMVTSPVQSRSSEGRRYASAAE